MNIINGLFGDYLFVSLAVLFLTILVLLLSHFLKEKYSPHWRMGIWKTCIFCLLIPITLIFRMIKNILESAGIEFYKNAGTDALQVALNVIENAAQSEASIENFHNVATEAVTMQTGWVQMLSLIWFVGMLALVAFYIAYYVIYRLNLNRRCAASQNLQKNILIDLPNCKKRRVKILFDPKCKTPYVTGAIKPIIVFPCRKYSEREREFLLMHEITHIKRCDILLTFCAYLMIAVHWFNPAVYVIYKNLRRDLELCCDCEVLEGKDKIYRYEYCQTILKEASISVQENYALATSFSDAKSTIKRRFKLVIEGGLRMKKGCKNILIALSISLITVFAITGCVLNEDAYAEIEEINAQELIASDEYQALIQQAISDKNEEVADKVKKASAESNAVYYLNEQEVKNHTDEKGNVDEEWLENQLAGFQNEDADTSFDEKSKEIEQSIYAQSSYAPHVLANGDIGTYYDSEEKVWTLKAGDSVKINVFSDKDYYNSTGKVNYGYVKDGGERVDVDTNYVLQGEDSLEFTVPEDGEYYFCILCAAGEPIVMEYVDINISR